MHPLIESRRAELAELCRRFGVRQLEVFGSAAREEDFDESRSDIDLLVTFLPDGATPGLAQYFDLKFALEALFAREVDLVETGSVRNPYVLASIEHDKQPLFSA